MMDVSQFIDSQEMREYLKTVQLSERTCEELVCGAPKPLAEKLSWLEQQGSARAEEVGRALKGLELKPGEFLYLTEKWYDNDFIWWNQSSGVPFSSLDAAVRHIRQEMAEEEWDEDSLCWTRLEKWVPGEDGAYHQPYTYFLIRDDVVYFDRFPTGKRDCFCGAPNLDVPMPFQPGDIVSIDCRPFMPRKLVVLLEVDDHNCYGVICLFRREDGEWEIGTVNHSRRWPSIRLARPDTACLPNLTCANPVISPLYRLASFQEELKEVERLLEKVSKYIDRDEKKGRNLWKNLYQELKRLNRCWMDEQEILRFLK